MDKKKVSTKECGRCGEAHKGYTIKKDSQGQEYVICGKTNKKMTFHEESPKKGVPLSSFIYYTVWTADEPDKIEIP